MSGFDKNKLNGLSNDEYFDEVINYLTGGKPDKAYLERRHEEKKQKNAYLIIAAANLFAEYLEYNGYNLSVTINDRLKFKRDVYIKNGYKVADFYVYYKNESVFDVYFNPELDIINVGNYEPGEWEKMLEKSVDYIEEQVNGKQKKI